METPTTIAKRLMSNIAWIDELYSGSIPSNVEVNTNKNTVLITEYLNEPSQYANMEIKYWLVGVEVQIFYKLDGDDFQNHELQVAKLFNDDRWHIDTSRNRIKDPDTKQWTKVFYFSKNLEMEEGI
nr:MAG TPA: tail completion protein [Caudoviricetes sp.]